jgi:hypothetical protein
MSPRAASRLEAFGFREVYDYVAGKLDWFACGLPREGAAADVPWVGDVLRDDVATCEPDVRVADVREAVEASAFDWGVVVDERRVVAGLLRGDALENDNARAEEVMELGPRTIRPSRPIEKLLGARSSEGVSSWLVTTSHGVLLGAVLRDDAERALGG